MGDIFEEADRTAINEFTSQFIIKEYYNNVNVFTNNKSNLEKAKEAIDNIAIEGFVLIDFYKNNDGEIYSDGYEYYAYLPDYDYELTDLMFLEAIIFITSKIEPKS